jgi:anti-sigma factor RsiW
MSRAFGPPAHLGDALSALLDGELAGPQEAAAHAHLAVCQDCAGELRAVSQARTWVRSLPAVDPPFGFYERMLLDHSPVPAGAGAFANRAAFRRRAGLAAIGAAAAAVTVLGVGSPSARPVSPAVPRLVEAHAASASVGADLLSKLAPAGVPVSFNR